jgi:hypothetical protein
MKSDGAVKEYCHQQRDSAVLFSHTVFCCWVAAPVTALSAEDDLLGSLGSRSTLAAEAAYNIAATPFKVGW